MKATLTLLIAALFAAVFFGFINQPEPRQGELHRAASDNRTAINDAFALFNQPQP